VHVSGGAPASRETELLMPGNTVERVDAIVLAGGSAFGLAAADGAMSWLAEHGRGFQVGDVRVPIVPAAALFDLTNGGDKSRVGRDPLLYVSLGRAACEAAGDDTALGTIGAGTGATTADLKGGFGWAESTLVDGSLVAAFVAANALGRVTIGTSPHFRAAPFEQEGEFGGLGLPSPTPSDAGSISTKLPAAGASTTLAAIVTDCELTRTQAKRLAITAHDGLALAIFPAHTPFDGDTVFALSTGARPAPADPHAMVELCAVAAATLARAIARAVYAAEPAAGDRLPTWRQRYGGGLQ
jgi:L-aminopeptidase/D-esterase-like protein